MTRRELISAGFLIAVLGVVAGIVSAFGDAYVNRVAITIGIFAILTASLVLFNGLTGVFSIGHVAFMAIGAYVGGVLTLPIETKATALPDLPHFLATTELPFAAATLVAGTVAMMVALLLGWAILRLSGNFVVVATLALLVIVRDVLLNAERFTRGARTFHGVLPLTDLTWVCVWMVIAVYTVWRVKRSSFGRRMICSRDDRPAAEAQGINILRARLLAFGISAFFTAVAGSLYAHFLLAFSPRTFYLGLTFQVIAMLVIGGMGSVSGALLGSSGITIMSEIGRLAERGFDLGPIHIPAVYGLSQVALGVLFILIMIFRPQGLLGDRELAPLSWLDRLRRPTDRRAPKQDQ